MLNETRRTHIVEKIKMVDFVKRKAVSGDGAVNGVGKVEDGKRRGGEEEVGGECSERAVWAWVVVEYGVFVCWSRWLHEADGGEMESLVVLGDAGVLSRPVPLFSTIFILIPSKKISFF